MAGAIIGGLDRALWRVVVCEVVPARRKELEETFKVETVSDVADRKIQVRFSSARRPAMLKFSSSNIVAMPKLFSGRFHFIRPEINEATCGLMNVPSRRPMPLFLQSSRNPL